MKICIGIISYIPDDMKQKRQESIQSLFNKLDELFPDQPVLIITQNWKDYLPKTTHDIIRVGYDKPLGIIQARIKLREEFLASNFDYMIMLDDDSKIIGNDSSVYLKEIEDHPDGFGWFSNHLLKLFAISKNVYSKIEMPNVSAEKFEGFEDKLFISMCRIRFPELEFEFSHGNLKEVSYGDTSGPPSTWWNSETRKHRQEMRDKTDQLIRDYMKKYNNTTFVIPGDDQPSKPEVNKVNQPPSQIIDIVIPYVNNQDVKWQGSFEYWKHHENLDNDNRDQVVSNIRYRDMGTFQFFFRSVEKYCPWFNKIFLILQNENQIPRWLDTTNPRLRIVYHDEYIPSDLLPTFNSNVIEMFVSDIPDLSDNYILCNDDTFFINNIQPEMFFINNKPVYCKSKLNDMSIHDDFSKTISNNYDLLEEITGTREYYYHWHLQTPHKKSTEKEILRKYRSKIKDSFKTSRFRNRSNYTTWLYDEYLKIMNLGINNPSLYRGCSNIILSNIDFSRYKNHKLICVNDTPNTKDFYGSSEKLRVFLQSKLPNKSSFENENYIKNSPNALDLRSLYV